MKIALLLSCLINVILLCAVYFLLNNSSAISLPVTDNFSHPTHLKNQTDFARIATPPARITVDDAIELQIPDVEGSNISGESLAALLELAEAGYWQKLAPKLTEYLYQHPDDVQAQLLEGRVIIHTQTSAAGLEYLYTVLDKLNEPQDIELIGTYIQHHAIPIIDSLTDNRDWTALATFIEPLIQYEPQATTYIKPLALAYAMLNLPDAMENTLASLPDGHHLIQQTRHLWSQQFARQYANNGPTAVNTKDPLRSSLPNSSLSPADITVPLINRNGQWFSPFSVGNEHFQLLLDTGASTTAISGEAFSRIPKHQRQFLGRILINTASGQAQARLFSMRNVALGTWKIKKIDVVVLPVDRLSGFDGLLGMNVLNRSQVVIDQISGALEVRTKQ